jgi:hypothetical protein
MAAGVIRPFLLLRFKELPMISRITFALLVAATLAMPLAFAACEVHHEESTKQGLFGGTTHEETTTTRNPITGDVSTEHTKESVK